MAVDRRREIEAVRNSKADKGRRILGSEPHVQLSYWKYSTYKKCPQQYLLHCIATDYKVEKLEDDNFFAIAGSVVHGLFEDFFLGARTGTVDIQRDSAFLTDQAAERYDQFVAENPVAWDVHRIEPKEHRESVVPSILTSLDWTYNELFRMGIMPRDPNLLHPEFKFRTHLKNPRTGNPLPIILTGRVDLVVEPTPAEIQALRIVDYKDVDKKSSNSLNWRQLVWYCFGIEPHFNLPCNWSAFCLTKLRSWMDKNPDAINARDSRTPRRTFRSILFEDMLEVALAIRRDAFPAVVSRHHCYYCPVKSQCPEFYSYAGQETELMADLAALKEGTVSFDG